MPCVEAQHAQLTMQTLGQNYPMAEHIPNIVTLCSDNGKACIKASKSGNPNDSKTKGN